MSESAIDSAQNGINATLSSTFLKGKSVNWSRAFVILVNIVLLIIAATEFATSVLSLFLVGNMLCTATAMPVVSGLIQGPTARYVFFCFLHNVLSLSFAFFLFLPLVLGFE